MVASNAGENVGNGCSDVQMWFASPLENVV